MVFAKSLTRPLVLIALFAVGIWLIRHIGQDLYPSKESAPIASPGVVVEPAFRSPVSAAPLAENPPQSMPANTVAMSRGPRLSKTDRGQFIATDPILFNSGAATLRETSIPRLDKIGEYLKRHPGITVEIIGHTDNLGPEPVNQKVSAERAEIVMNYLTAQGIAPSRLRSRGMGSLDPIESNDTQLGRQANRRIEFRITGDAEGQ